MIKHLYLVRHGETNYEAEGKTDVKVDLGLSIDGVKQAELTGKRLAGWPKEVNVYFYSSDLPSAKATAEIISKFIGRTPQFVKELRDPRIKEKLVEEPPPQDAGNKKFWQIEDPLLEWISGHSESKEPPKLQGKLPQFMDKIQRDNQEIVLIVSHDTKIASIIHWWLEFSEKHAEKTSFDIDPGSITRLRTNPQGQKIIAKLNDTGHLAEMQR